MDRHAMKSEWILQHGWGFDRHLWKEWMAAIPSNIKINLCDRGYFGAQMGPISFDLLSSFKVIVAHSFGAHLVPSLLLQQANLLVLIGAFSIFPADQYIEKMYEQLFQEPLHLMKRFYQRSFAPQLASQLIPQSIMTNNLAVDLKSLQSSVLDIAQIACIPKVLILHGEKDKIVPLSKAEDLHKQLPNSHLAIVENGGHVLPATHAVYCCQTILQEMLWD